MKLCMRIFLCLTSSFCFLPLFFCAGPIDPTNIYDPLNQGGDYRYQAVLFPEKNKTYAVFYPCTLLFHDTGTVRYKEFYLDTLPIFADNTALRLESNRSERIMFVNTCAPCSLFIRAVRQNGVEEEDTVELSVVNPYAIELDSASYLKADTVKFRIKNNRRTSPYDTLLKVKWFREGEDARTTDYDQPQMIRVILPDTITLSADLIDPSGHKVALSVIQVPVCVKQEPVVRIDALQIAVPLNNEFPVNAFCRDADSLVWTTKHLAVTNATSQTTGFTHRWTEPLTDTLIVTAKNRFGTIGNSDTVVIKPQQYRFDLKRITFPEEVLARKVWEWEVEVIDNNADSVVTDSTVRLQWELEPDLFLKGAILDLNTADTRLRFHYPDTVSSFILKVTASNGTESSWLLESNIRVLNHVPIFTSVTVFPKMVPVGDSVDFSIIAKDTNSGGSVRRLFYKTNSVPADSQMYTSKMTVRLPFGIAGEQEVYFWCVDNDGLVSDTAVRTVTVTAERPFFLKARKDTSVYIGQHMILSAGAWTNRANDSIVSWTWLDSNMNVIRTTEYDTIDTAFSGPGIHRINVQCKSVRGDTADKPAIRNVRVSLGLPVVGSAEVNTPDSLYVNDLFTMRIAARDSNGTVARLLVSRTTITSDPAVDADTITIAADTLRNGIDTVITVRAPRVPGVYAYSVVAVDNKGQSSPAVTAADSLAVFLGKPGVDEISPDNCWMNDSVTYTISAHDGNGSVVSYWLRWGEDGSFTKSTTGGTVRQLFPSHGNTTLYCYVEDNDGVRSGVFEHSITVRQGKPRIGTIAVDKQSSEIYVNDSVVFTVIVADSNDTKINMSISWNGNTVFEQEENDVTVGEVRLSHTFDNSMLGERTVRFKATDADGNKDSTTFTLTVNKGPPSIKDIAVDTADNCIFVNDDRMFTIDAGDGNGYLRIIYINWQGDSTAQDSIVMEENVNDVSVRIGHRYPIGESGTRKIAVWAIDDDGMRSSSYVRTITVLKGMPLVKKENVDTFWVNDENQLTFDATDPNGSVVRSFVDWDRNGVWDESLEYSQAFTHAWDTTYGDRVATYEAKVMDEDSVYSDAKTCSAFIRMGRPVIRGASFGDTVQWKESGEGIWDTMFVVCRNANYYESDNTYRSGPFYLRLQASDPNGQAISYFWDFGANGTIDQNTNEPSLYWNREIVNTPGKYRVAVKDDDSLMSDPLDFILYVDEVPPVPTTTSDPSSGGRIIRWLGKDVKDGDSTLYKIVAKMGTDSITVTDENDARYIVKDFQPGYQYDEDDTYDFKYTYTPDQGEGIYHYRIIAKDARGSLSRTSGDPTFSFSAE